MSKSCVYSQGLQIKSLCSDSHKLQKHFKDIKNWFFEKRCPEGLIDGQLQRVKGKSIEGL